MHLMNTKLIKKENSLSQSKATSTMSTENENILFLEPLSNKEVALLKIKHFFFSRKAKINNIINGLDNVLSDPTHWLDGKPVTPIAKLIASERHDHHLSTLRLDDAYGIPWVNNDIALIKAVHDVCNFPILLRINLSYYDTHTQNRFIGIFSRSMFQSAAPDLVTGIVPKGTNLSFPITKTALKILYTLDIIRKINQIQPEYLNKIKDYAFHQYCQLDSQNEDSVNATDGFLVYKTYENPDIIQKYLPSISPVARQKILDHTEQVPIIKKLRDQMTEVEMNNYSNFITNNNKLIEIQQIKQCMLSHDRD